MCTLASHVALVEIPSQFIKVSLPASRQRDPDVAGGWIESRTCIECGSTLSFAGTGDCLRWCYRVDVGRGRHVEAMTLEAALSACIRYGASADDVQRDARGPHEGAPITMGESAWLRASLLDRAARDVERGAA